MIPFTFPDDLPVKDRAAYFREYTDLMRQKFPENHLKQLNKTTPSQKSFRLDKKKSFERKTKEQQELEEKSRVIQEAFEKYRQEVLQQLAQEYHLTLPESPA